MIINIILFIIILAVLVLVHEFGHFFAARRARMRIEEFGFGFPPRIKGWMKNGVLWSINAIPLGGFVKIAGEDGQDADQRRQDVDQRGLNVDHSDVFEVSNYVNFAARPIWQRTLVLIAGVVMNFILGWALLWVIFMVGSESSVVITDVAPDSPAALARIEPGDIILGYQDIEQFVSYINEHRGKEVVLSVVHSGAENKVIVTPRENPPVGEGALGVALANGGVERMTIFSALWESLKSAGRIFSFIYIMLFKLVASIFSGDSLWGNVSGPIGIFKATSQAAGLGFLYLLNLVALISLNLAAINIFPFPALDGGRIIFLIVEKIKGSPVSVHIQQLVNGIGFGLLLLLMLVVTIQDVIKIF